MHVINRIITCIMGHKEKPPPAPKMPTLKSHGVALSLIGDELLYSALMPAALMIGHHFSISAF
jgi:hypothetical protein